MSASPVFYDAPSVLHTVRLRASVLSAGFGIGGAAFLLLGPSFDPLAVGLVGAACVAIGLLVWARMARVSWRISVSASSVWGLNFARKRTALDWSEVVSLDIHASGLTLIGRTCADGRRPVLAVPSSFPRFTDLAHDLVASAHTNYVPVLVDGMMWQELDVYTFYEIDEPDPILPPPYTRRSGADGAGHHLA